MQKLSVMIGNLAIVDENVKNEARRQPMLFVEAARYRVAKMRDVARLKATLEAETANVSLSVRAKVKGQAERVTEGHIKSRVLLNKTIRSLQAELNQAEQREEFAKLLLESYRMRRDALRIIDNAQNYESMKESSEIERMDQNRKLKNRAMDLHRRRILNRTSEEG